MKSVYSPTPAFRTNARFVLTTRGDRKIAEAEHIEHIEPQGREGRGRTLWIKDHTASRGYRVHRQFD